MITRKQEGRKLRTWKSNVFVPRVVNSKDIASAVGVALPLTGNNGGLTPRSLVPGDMVPLPYRVGLAWLGLVWCDCRIRLSPVGGCACAFVDRPAVLIEC
jgi:hypothetical protein